MRYFEELFKTKSIKEISEEFSIDYMVLNTVFNVVHTYLIDCEDVTISYIVALYKNGFSYQEIGDMKGISKMGVRYHLKENLSETDISMLKYQNSVKRKELKDLIFRKEIVLKLTEDNYEEIRKLLGYSKSYFQLIVANSDRKFRGSAYER